jgi:hypothetical protein
MPIATAITAAKRAERERKGANSIGTPFLAQAASGAPAAHAHRAARSADNSQLDC